MREFQSKLQQISELRKQRRVEKLIKRIDRDSVRDHVSDEVSLILANQELSDEQAIVAILDILERYWISWTEISLSIKD